MSDSPGGGREPQLSERQEVDEMTSKKFERAVTYRQEAGDTLVWGDWFEDPQKSILSRFKQRWNAV
jgi:hypothetical protein